MQVKKNVQLPIGAKVRIRPDLDKHKEYDGNSVTSEMMRNAGKIVIVERNIGYKNGGYRLEGIGFAWTYDMLEYVDNEDAFEMLLNGQINEETYKEMTTEGTL